MTGEDGQALPYDAAWPPTPNPPQSRDYLLGTQPSHPLPMRLVAIGKAFMMIIHEVMRNRTLRCTVQGQQGLQQVKNHLWSPQQSHVLTTRLCLLWPIAPRHQLKKEGNCQLTGQVV